MTVNDVHEILDGWRSMPPGELDGRRALLVMERGTVVDGRLMACDRPGGMLLEFDEAPGVIAAMCRRRDGAWRSTPTGRSLIVYRERPDHEGVRA